MKHFLFLLFFIPLFSTAANDSTSTRNFKRISIGVSFTPGVAYRLLSYNQPTLPPPFTDSLYKAVFFDKRNKEERPIFGFNAGAIFGVNMLKWLSIETGFEYSMKGYNRTSKNLIGANSYNPNGTIDSLKMYTLKQKSVYHYIEIPAGFNFHFGAKKVKACIRTGVYLDWLMAFTSSINLSSPSAPAETTKKTSYKFQRVNRINCSPYLGIGFSYELNEAMRLDVTPMASMQAISTDQTPISSRLWNAGVSIVFHYGFIPVK